MSRARLFTLTTTACAGTLAAHAAGYAVVVPAGTHRHTLLTATGHAYMSGAVKACTFALALGLVACVVIGYRRGRHTLFAGVPTVTRLVAAQTAAYLAMELTERVLSRAGFDSSFSSLLCVGLLLQIVVGAAGGIVLVLLDRVGARLAQRSTWRPRPVAAPLGRRLVAAVHRPKDVLAQSWGNRGPPSGIAA